MTDPLKLTPEECEQAIDKMVEARNGTIRQIAKGSYSQPFGWLEKVEADLRALRKLQAEAGAGRPIPIEDAVMPLPYRTPGEGMPAWLKEAT